MVAASEVDHRNVQRLTELYDSHDIEQGIYEEKDERKSKQRIKSLTVLLRRACSLNQRKRNAHFAHNPLHNAQMAQTHALCRLHN